MVAIFKREFKSLFTNVIGWVFIALIVFVFGLYFFVNNLVYGSPYVSYALNALPVVLMIGVPILTMRVFAEERHSKTDQLILTAPVSVGKIVVGKFLAVATVYTIITAFICTTPIILSIFGEVAYSNSYVAILGYWLLGLTGVAVGCFASSITENQIVSAVVSFVLLFAGFMMKSITSVISTSGNALTKVLSIYDLSTPADNFSSGIIDLAGIVYYISLICLFLFLATQSINKRRFEFSFKTISTSAFSGITIILVLAITVFVNLVVRELPNSYTNIDLSRGKLYTICDETKDYLNSLDKDTIEILVVGTKEQISSSQYSEYYSNIVKTLDIVDGFASVNVKYVDIYDATGFGTATLSPDTDVCDVIVRSAKRQKQVTSDSMYTYNYSFSGETSIKGYDGEGKLVSAIQYTLTDEVPFISQLTGHSESELPADFASVIEKMNVTSEQVNFLSAAGVSEGSDGLIIHAPQTDFSKDDIKKVDDYLKAGGNVLITLDCNVLAKQSNLKEFLNEYKIEALDGILAESDTDHFYQQNTYLLPTVEAAELTRNIDGELTIFLPQCGALKYNSEDVNFTNLMTSSSKARLVALDGSEESDESKFVIGLTRTCVGGGTLTVIASPYIFSDNANNMVGGRNAIFLENVIDKWAGSFDASTFTVPDKEYQLSNLTISATAVYTYGFIFIIAIPLSCLIAAIAIWTVRRKR